MKLNITIREAVISDAEGIAKVHVDSWRTTYRGIMPDHVLDDLSYEKRAQSRLEMLEKNDPSLRCFVAESVGGGIIGFAMAGPRREGPQKYTGEVYAIYLLKEFQGQGIGRTLFVRTAEWLQAQGHSSILVWAAKENSAVRFYEALNGREIETKKFEIGGLLLDEVSFGWDLRRNFLTDQLDSTASLC